MKQLKAKENRGMFIGDFSTFTNALKNNGMPYPWLVAKYVEGLMTIDGSLAIISITDRCTACIHASWWSFV